MDKPVSLCLRCLAACLVAALASWTLAAENGTTDTVETAVTKAQEARSNWTGLLRAVPTNTDSTVVATLAYSDGEGIRTYGLYTADLVLAGKIRELAAQRARVVLHGVLRAEGNAIVVDACRELAKKDKRHDRARSLPF